MRGARVLLAGMGAGLLLAAAAPAEESAPPVAAAHAPSPAGVATAHELNATDAEAWLDGLMSYGLKNGDIAGAVVAVVKDGKVLYQSGYGYADVEHKKPMDAESVMTRIGSTSKLFTWIAVMQLVEQGKLDLNENVDKYVDFKVSPASGKPITLTDLMNHRGGFEEGLKDVLTFDPQRAQSTATYLKEHPRPLLFPAGTVPAYSNYGASLAGYIVERASGEAFDRYIEDHIFLPLGMHNSTFAQPLPERFKGKVSNGYRTASLPPQPYELVVTRPAGSVTTTAADMTRFMLALLQQGSLDGASILRSETVQTMYSASETVPAGFAAMAHGFFRETRNGRTVIGHGGDTVFFHTDLAVLPDEGVGIFCSFNSRGRDEAVYGLRQALINQFLDRYFPRAPDVQKPATLASATADAQKIAGRYESSRRIEHGFLSIFYLLQQATINANGDGTIDAPKAFEPGNARYREVAPNIWREIDGTRQLALETVNGIKTVVDSENPTSVFQEVPGHRAAPLNMTILAVSFAVAVGTVLLWPILFLFRRRYQHPLTSSVEARRARLFLRVGALFDVLWLLAWTFVLMPVLSTQLDVYSTSLDGVIRTLQIAGLVVIGLALLGAWSFWRLCRAETSVLARIGNGVIAAALLGLVWVGWLGGLIGFNVNY